MSTMSPPPWSFFLIFNIILRPWISTQVYQGTRGRGCGKLFRMSFWSLLLAQRSLDNLTWSQWLCRRATPNSSHPRPTTLLLLEGKSTTKKLIANDVIKESDSPWASLFVLVRQKGKDCFCVDYQKTNKVLRADQYPIPRWTLSRRINPKPPFGLIGVFTNSRGYLLNSRLSHQYFNDS